MESFDTTGLDQKVLPDQIKTAYANNHVVLSNLYKIVQPLSSLFPLHLHDQLLYPTDTVEYSFLFHKTLVGSNIKVDFMPLDQRALPDSSMEPGGRMKDIIESAQRIIWSEFVMDLKLQKLALEEYKKHQFGKGKDVGLNNNCNNLLVLGFGRNFNPAFPPSIIQENTIVSYLEASPEWATLLERIGSTRMIKLLSSKEIGLFIPLISEGKENYLQISGVAVIQAKPSLPKVEVKKNLRKRKVIQEVEGLKKKRRKRRHQRSPILSQAEAAEAEEEDYWAQIDQDCKIDFDTIRMDALGERILEDVTMQVTVLEPDQISAVESESPSKQGRPKLANPSEIFIQRVRIYYSRSTFVYAWNGRLQYQWGFGRLYILNKLTKLFPVVKTSNTAPVDSVASAVSKSKAIHLLKYIFPLRFKIKNNIFEFVKQDYFGALTSMEIDRDREVELKKLGNIGLPKRLHSTVVELAKRLIVLHEKCEYNKHFNERCPSKITGDAMSEVERSSILASLSGDLISQQPASQFSLDHSTLTNPTSSHLPQLNTPESKPTFQQFLIPFHQVEGFIRSIISKVIPHAFWGTEKNFCQVWKHVQTFIRNRRFEMVSLHFIMSGISLLDIDWLALPSQNKKKGKPNQIEMETRKQTFLEFMYWFFDSFVINLINSNFYVTESGSSKTRTIYFRKDDWATLTQPILNSLTKTTFERIHSDDVHRLLNNRTLGFAYIRLLPKANGARPIVNLKRRIKRTLWGGKVELGSSINSILTNAFRVLTFEKNRNISMLGGSVFGPSEIYAKLKRFKLSRQQNGSHLPKLFFVKVDVKSCFDTIEQSKVLSIVDKLIVESEYRVIKYGRLLPVNTAMIKVSKKWEKVAGPAIDSLSFPILARTLAQELNYAVLCDQVLYPTEKRIDLLRLIKEHLTTNLVQINGLYYKQTSGIPQGSILSGLFCGFFFGDFEETQLGFTNNQESILMRMTDDFLLITTKKSIATRFLNKMSEGNSDYGCFIAKEKSMINFRYSVDGVESIKRVEKSNDFPWCGLIINTTDLNVKTDLERQKHFDISDASTVERCKKPGATFLLKMLRVVKRQCHIIYTDTQHNSLYTVYLNVYQNNLIAATRFEAYVRDWHADPRGNVAFFLRAIKTTLTYCYAAIGSGVTTKMAKENSGTSKVRKELVVWLGQHAFHRVLSRKPAIFLPIIEALAFDLSLKRTGLTRTMMNRVISHPDNRFIENKKRKI